MTIDRDELKRLCEAATEGPWTVISEGPQANPAHVYVDHSQDVLICVTGDFERADQNAAEDAAFICAARAAVPELLGELEETEADLADAEQSESELKAALADVELNAEEALTAARTSAYLVGLKRAAEICKAKREEWKDHKIGGEIQAAHQISAARQLEKAILAEASREEEKKGNEG